MSRYPGPPSVPPGQPMPSVGVYSPQGMTTQHMPSPQTAPPYNMAVSSPSQYGQQPGPSPTQGHYPHPQPQPVMVGPTGGYGQPMMHGMMPQGLPPQPQQPVTVPSNQPPTIVPQPTPQPAAVPQPQVQQPPPQPAPDDLGVRVKRAYASFENNLKTFLHEYSSILQMDDARYNSQTPEYLAQVSQNLVRRYESLLITLDLFESNLRMLQDYNATQTDFRRVFNPTVPDRRPMGGGQGDAGQYPGLNPSVRPVDPAQYQLFLTRMQTQIDSINAIRETGKKFLDSSSTQLSSSGK